METSNYLFSLQSDRDSFQLCNPAVWVGTEVHGIISFFANVEQQQSIDEVIKSLPDDSPSHILCIGDIITRMTVL